MIEKLRELMKELGIGTEPGEAESAMRAMQLGAEATQQMTMRAMVDMQGMFSPHIMFYLLPIAENANKMLGATIIRLAHGDNLEAYTLASGDEANFYGALTLLLRIDPTITINWKGKIYDKAWFTQLSEEKEKPFDFKDLMSDEKGK